MRPCTGKGGKEYMPAFTTKLITAALTLIARIRERPLKGQSLVEYSLILSFVSILAIVALQFLQPAISNTLKNVANTMNAVAGSVHAPPLVLPAANGCGNGNSGNSGNGGNGGNGCGNGGNGN